jgi:hypothetical protein
MEEIITVPGAILSKFKTIKAFAKTIGWKRTKASRIVNQIQQPDTDDIYQLTECLGIEDSNTFILLFFPALSTKWTNKSLSKSTSKKKSNS